MSAFLHLYKYFDFFEMNKLIPKIHSINQKAARQFLN